MGGKIMVSDAELSSRVGIPVTVGDWWLDTENAPKVISLLEERIPRSHLEGSKIVISGSKLSELKLLGVSRGIASYEDLDSTSHSSKGTLYIQSYRDVPHEVGHHVYSSYLTAAQRRRVSNLCRKALGRGDLAGIENQTDPSEFFASAYYYYLSSKKPLDKGRDKGYYSRILRTTYKGMSLLLDEVFSRR